MQAVNIRDALRRAKAERFNHKGHAETLQVIEVAEQIATGSMVGNLLGCVYGVKQIPSRWIETLELRAVITQLAGDLLSAKDLALDRSLVQRYGSGL